MPNGLSFIQSTGKVETGLTPDFILAIGDEESDEMMFETVKDFSRGVMGEAPTTPDTVTTPGQHGPALSSSRRRGSYQVTGHTAKGRRGAGGGGSFKF